MVYPPRAAVIIPVYNDAMGIETVLTALLNQSYPAKSYTIVVADNGSTDLTLRIVQQFQERFPNLIRLVEETTIQSSYAARNVGIRSAQGEIMAFTDADCMPQPTWIAAGVEALLERSAVTGGGRITFSYQGNRPNIYEYFDSARKLDQKSYVEQSGFAATANFFVRKEIFERYGPFRWDLVSGGDYEFGRRLTQAGEKMIYISDAVVQHPARPTLQAILKKSIRVARGQKQLERLGLLEHDCLSWRQLCPSRSYPRDERWAASLSSLEKAQLILLQNAVHWLNFAIRVGPR
jgi:glycosyltransferase involved in cell wall biosynthesis